MAARTEATNGSAVLRSSRAGSKWRSTKSAIDSAMIQSETTTAS